MACRARQGTRLLLGSTHRVDFSYCLIDMYLGKLCVSRCHLAEQNQREAKIMGGTGSSAMPRLNQIQTIHCAYRLNLASPLDRGNVDPTRATPNQNGGAPLFLNSTPCPTEHYMNACIYMQLVHNMPATECSLPTRQQVAGGFPRPSGAGCLHNSLWFLMAKGLTCLHLSRGLPRNDAARAAFLY